MRTFAKANQKGGVGKTTSTYFLAWALVMLGYRVLVVDIDPQGNVSRSLTRELEPDQLGLADVLSEETDIVIGDALVPGLWGGLVILPTPVRAALRVVGEELTIAPAGTRERRLAAALEEVADDFDVCLIDCPPALNQLTVNALVASDDVVIVTEPGMYAVDGLGEQLEAIDEVRAYYQPDLKVAGILVNLYDPRTIRGKHWLNEIVEYAAANELRVLEPVIHKRVVIADAAEAEATLADYGEPELANIYLEHGKNLMNGAA